MTVTQVAIVSSSGGSSNNYVLQGEKVQISCHYVLTKPNEKIISVSWLKDGQHVS